RTVAPEPIVDVLPIDHDAYERARQSVRTPGRIMLALGCLGLFPNLFMAGFGYVDDFVTPLASSSKKQWEEEKAAKEKAAKEGPDTKADTTLKEMARRKRSAVVAIVMLAVFAIGSAVTIWAAYNMLHLRNYWVAILGSISLMPGACLCLFLGIPVGIWAMV